MLDLKNYSDQLLFDVRAKSENFEVISKIYLKLDDISRDSVPEMFYQNVKQESNIRLSHPFC